MAETPTDCGPLLAALSQMLADLEECERPQLWDQAFVERDDWIAATKRAIAALSPSAPAAPSVGEPEVNALADEALAEYDRGETRPVKLPRTPAQRIANYRRALRQLQRAYDLSEKVSMLNAMRARDLSAELAALRSSLEEARKDSERLDWLMKADDRPWTRAEIDENLIDESPSRAPSPRDEP